MINRETGQKETNSFEIRIPPGATDGRRIRVAGQGEPGHGNGPAGDLYLRVRHAAHPEFSSRGSDIYHELEITPWEAVLGAEIAVSTLDGTVKLRVPAGSENGLSMRVRGRGLPKGKTGERGDFFVILNVLIPAPLNDEERAAGENLRDVSTFQARPTHKARSTAQ